MLNISFQEKNLLTNDTIAILVNSQLKIDKGLMLLDKNLYNSILNIIENKSHFTGRLGKTLTTVISCQSSKSHKTVIIIGIGNEFKIKQFELEEIGGLIYNQGRDAKAKNIGVQVYSGLGKFSIDDTAKYIGSGALLAAYKFNKYKTKVQEGKDKSNVAIFNIIVKDSNAICKLFKEKQAIARGVYLARDLVNEAPNILYPASYAQLIVENLKSDGVVVNVLGETEMRSLGMNALLGVGQGSARQSKVVIMKYYGENNTKKPVGLVGKGVTFDTGGISLKPSTGMESMKYDMGGSASVVGVIKALALRKAKVNVVGIVGLVENMPGSNAQRPGDVVKTMSGQTVEVLNTDAEGRLVLCDCITYLQTYFDSECIVDLATLTGAAIISLANIYAACFSNDESLANNLIRASHSTNEKLWRMPLNKGYDDMLESPIADMRNIGNEGGAAGSCTAAQFIGRFIKEGVKWAHLDIAGVAWEKKDKNPICPKGAVGFGVRLLNQFIQDNYEIK